MTESDEVPSEKTNISKNPSNGENNIERKKEMTPLLDSDLQYIDRRLDDTRKTYSSIVISQEYYG